MASYEARLLVGDQNLVNQVIFLCRLRTWLLVGFGTRCKMISLVQAVKDAEDESIEEML